MNDVESQANGFYKESKYYAGNKQFLEDENYRKVNTLVDMVNLDTKKNSS